MQAQTEKATSIADTSIRQNFLILLDISDRILVSGQVQEDTMAIFRAMDCFGALASRKLYILSKDRLRVAILPQQNAAVRPEDYDERLTLDVSRIPIADRAATVPQRLADMKAAVAEVYRKSLGKSRREEFEGARLWAYFNQTLTDDCPPTATIDGKQRPNHSRVLVVTDGYLDFEHPERERQVGSRAAHSRFVQEVAAAGADWEKQYEAKGYGFLPLESRFEHAELMVGLRPKADYHYEILTRAWTDWLDKAGIKMARRPVQAGQRTYIKEAVEGFMCGG